MQCVALCCRDFLFEARIISSQIARESQEIIASNVLRVYHYTNQLFKFKTQNIRLSSSQICSLVVASAESNENTLSIMLRTNISFVENQVDNSKPTKEKAQPLKK